MKLPRSIEIDGQKMPYLSPSAINLLLTCAKKFEFRYVLGLQEERDERDSIFGVSIHAAMELASKKLVGGETLRPEETGTLSQDIFRKTMDSKTLDYTQDDEREIWNAGRMLWQNMINRSITPSRIEEQVIYKFDDKSEEYPWAMMGYLDMVAIEKGLPVIIDFKTTKRSPNNGQASRSHMLQILLYVAALRSVGVNISKAYVVYVVRKKYPDIIWAEVPITEGYINWALSVAKSVKRIVDLGEFTPNPMSMLCTERWCGFFSICPGAFKDSEVTKLEDFGASI